MSESMKRSGINGAGNGGGESVSSASKKSVEDLWAEFNAIADNIGKTKAQMTKPENALDLPKIKASISNMCLSAASICITFINMAREDGGVEKKLIALSGKNDILKVLSARIEVFFQGAKKYGSSVKSATPTTTLDDIKGQEDVKEVIRSFVFLAKHPELFETYKIKGGLGLMMYGAPGTGKTMFAEAIANAMQLPLFVISPADLFKSYVGASEQAVRQIFDDISAFSDGAILFVDECESIFTRRDKDGGKDYKSAVTSELLQRMNGEGVDGSRRIMVAATNRPWDIDPAYLRYKRFSHLVHIAPPDMEAIAAIIHSKLKGVPVEGDLQDIEAYALELIEQKLNPKDGERMYCSAADICGVIENACRMAVEQVMQENQANKDEKIHVVNVNKDMIRRAVAAFKPSLTESDKKLYDNFTPDALKKGD